MREINRKLKVNKIKGKMPLVHRTDEEFYYRKALIDEMREKVESFF